MGTSGTYPSTVPESDGRQRNARRVVRGHYPIVSQGEDHQPRRCLAGHAAGAADQDRLGARLCLRLGGWRVCSFPRRVLGTTVFHRAGLHVVGHAACSGDGHGELHDLFRRGAEWRRRLGVALVFRLGGAERLRGRQRRAVQRERDGFRVGRGANGGGLVFGRAADGIGGAGQGFRPTPNSPMAMVAIRWRAPSTACIPTRLARKRWRA